MVGNDTNWLLRKRSSKSGTLAAMLKRNMKILLGSMGLLLLTVLLFQAPALWPRLEWRYEVWSTYLKNVVDPVGQVPTPLPSTPFPTFTPLPPTPTLLVTQPPTPALLPLPPQVSLPSPKYELQGINNCGPATLAMTLRMYGWDSPSQPRSEERR